MSGIENTIIARFEKAGEKFEILVDPKLSYEYKTGAKKDLNNVLVVEEVFKDAKRGDRHTAAALRKAFGTEDVFEIAKKIFADGELQLTTDQRRKLVEEKRARVIALIAANVIDPRTKTPHPPARIEKALDQAKWHADAFKPADEQMKDAIEMIREIIPVSMEKLQIAVKVPAQFAAKCYGTLKEYGIRREEWASDGSLMAVIEIPAGVQAEAYDRLNKMTSGMVQTKQLN